MEKIGIPEKSDIPFLFRNYPELRQKIAWLPLGTFPTPVQPLNRLGFENLWVKRDDRSCSVYGGNKVRKLEFILAEARQHSTRHIVTFGGIGTNHGLATAIFCDRLDIDCTLLLFHQPVTGYVKQNLLLFEKYHAVTIYKKTRWRTVLAYYLLHRIRHPGACYVFAGGSNAAGTIGYVNAAFELKEQIDKGEIPAPAVVFCPLGSGGTLAGLSLGFALAGLRIRAVGVRVSESHLGPFQVCTERTVEKLMHKTYIYLKKRCRRLPDLTVRKPSIVENYFGGGYGVPTQAGSAVDRLVKKMEGIALDPTYTAKTFAAVFDHCRKHGRDSGPVLYWHTYNSVDLSAQADSVNYRNLPKALQVFIEEVSDVS
jgi:1-aminocyclopropane-1-carboxylate deaminase/D-cysteine desulfhydrase-like pyridoxal-dependent ACC family enzyme